MSNPRAVRSAHGSAQSKSAMPMPMRRCVRLGFGCSEARRFAAQILLLPKRMMMAIALIRDVQVQCIWFASTMLFVLSARAASSPHPSARRTISASGSPPHTPTSSSSAACSRCTSSGACSSSKVCTPRRSYASCPGSVLRGCITSQSSCTGWVPRKSYYYKRSPENLYWLLSIRFQFQPLSLDFINSTRIKFTTMMKAFFLFYSYCALV